MTTTQPKTQLKGVLMLLLTAFIWGSAFVAQSVGMEQVSAFTFNGIRTLMGAVVLLPFILIRDRRAARSFTPADFAARRLANRKVLRSGLILGVVFCAAGNFQQFAFNYAPSGKIAFVTALYMFFVPLLGLFIGKRVPVLTWICVFFGFVGLYFLCVNPDDWTAVNKGDVLTLVCSVLFAVHILLIEKFAPDADGIKLSCVQFAVSGVLSCICMFIFENPQIQAIKSAIIPLLYSGIMSCGVAYTFQIIGQKYTESTVASLIMCMESVFGVLSAAVVLHEMLSGREILGCCIMFAAILCSQVAEPLTEWVKGKNGKNGRSGRRKRG